MRLGMVRVLLVVLLVLERAIVEDERVLVGGEIE
jgi:hypothetical protein